MLFENLKLLEALLSLLICQAYKSFMVIKSVKRALTAKD